MPRYSFARTIVPQNQFAIRKFDIYASNGDVWNISPVHGRVHVAVVSSKSARGALLSNIARSGLVYNCLPFATFWFI